MKRKKLRPLRLLAQDCHRLWAEYIRKRDPECCLCGKPTTSAHHCLGKRIYPCYRFDVAVGIGLCHRCHLVVHHSPFNQILALGDDQIIELIDMARNAYKHKWTREGLEKVKSELAARIK